MYNNIKVQETKTILNMILLGAIALYLIFCFKQIDATNKNLSVYTNKISVMEISLDSLKQENCLLKQKIEEQEKQLQKYKAKLIVENKHMPKIEEDFTNEEINLICRVVNAEAGAYGFDAQRNVALVIFNRINDRRFPNNAHDVLYQHSNGVWQFSTIQNKEAFNKTPTEETKSAVYEAYECLEDYQKVIFFENLDSNIHESYSELCFSDNAHKFYRKEE